LAGETGAVAAFKVKQSERANINLPTVFFHIGLSLANTIKLKFLIIQLLNKTFRGL
jgi:hypothetical protein